MSAITETTPKVNAEIAELAKALFTAGFQARVAFNDARGIETMPVTYECLPEELVQVWQAIAQLVRQRQADMRAALAALFARMKTRTMPEAGIAAHLQFREIETSTAAYELGYHDAIDELALQLSVELERKGGQ